MLIGMRALQGIGAGGLTALGTVLIADIISPRERGRYMGLMGAVMGIGMVGGPLLGGVITDGAGWRWNFFLGLPFAVAAIIVLQRTLHLPARKAAQGDASTTPARRSCRSASRPCCCGSPSPARRSTGPRGRPPRWSAARC